MRYRLWFLLLTATLVSYSISPEPSLAQDLTPRYLVTYVRSRIPAQTDPVGRTATVVSIANQADASCFVSVEWFRSGPAGRTPLCSTDLTLGVGGHGDLCSRNIHGAFLICDAICAPELTALEGVAVVWSTCEQIGVHARVFYLQGTNETNIAAISDSKVVFAGEGNLGD
jgi:hypothetical protein